VRDRRMRGRRREPARGERLGQNLLAAALEKGHLTARDLLDTVFARIDQANLIASVRQNHAERQADVTAAADDRNRLRHGTQSRALERIREGGSYRRGNNGSTRLWTERATRMSSWG